MLTCSVKIQTMIFLNDILSAIPLGFFLSFMIGPVFFVLLETSVVKGFRAAVMFDLGVTMASHGSTRGTLVALPWFPP